MARGKKGQQPANLAAFSGGDHDQETIDKLNAANQAANAKAGHNSGEPPDEAIKRNANAIELALIEIHGAMKIVQKARADFDVARKTAKTDLGSKAWVDSIVAAVKLKLEAAKGGAGEIVTEHRQIGRTLRLLDDCPLGTQFELFHFADMDEPKASAMDAELQGQHAYSNGENLANNPFDPVGKTELYNDWRRGWMNAQAANARTMAQPEAVPA